MQVSIISSPNDGNYFAFVSFERHRTLSDIASILYSDEYRSDIDACTALILRPPVDVPINDLAILNIDCKRIIERFPLTPLYILYSNNFEIDLSNNLNFSAEEVSSIKEDKHDFIQFLRQKEMEKFITNSSAIIKSPTPKTLFRTPSQEYSHIFLRVGNIQKSRHVLDSIFFWTLPSLKEAGALLTDSWSISSIAFNIARLLSRYVSSDQNESAADAKTYTMGRCP